MAIITISRGTFSGGQGLAQCVAEKLGYRCIPRIELQQAAKRYHVSDEELSKAISGTPGILERLHSERVRYLACIRAALVKEVKDDKVVYHGLAGHFLLEGVPNVLRVRVIANMEFRIKGAMERGDLTREDAIQVIKTMDEKRTRWTKFLYHVDWLDPALYDIVINLDRISISGACEVVSLAVSQPEFQATPDSQKTIDDLVLSTEVKALIAAHKGISALGVEIEADAGIVTIGGTVESVADADKIREIVRTTPGVKEINSNMRVSSRSS